MSSDVWAIFRHVVRNVITNFCLQTDTSYFKIANSVPGNRWMTSVLQCSSGKSTNIIRSSSNQLLFVAHSNQTCQVALIRNMKRVGIHCVHLSYNGIIMTTKVESNQLEDEEKYIVVKGNYSLWTFSTNFHL